MGNSFQDLFPSIKIEDLQKLPSPFYLYSEQKIQNNIRKLLSAARKYFPDFQLHYAVKANGNPHLLKIIRDEGISVDSSSPVELQLASRMDFPMQHCIYTGNYESKEDFEIALGLGCIMNLDDGSRLEELAKIRLPEVVSFRINPGMGRGSHEKITTGGEKAKFGIPFENMAAVYENAGALGIKRFGIHVMTGSNILDAEHFANVTSLLFDHIEKYLSPLNIKLEFINIGGGLGIPYKPGESELDLDATFKNVKTVFDSRLASLNVGKPVLAMEPGRFIIGDCGHVIAKVQHIKQSYRSFLGIDAGMSTILRPAMYDAYHEVEVLNSSDEKADYFVCGQICESSDVFPEKRRLNKASVGDLVAIHNAGAYGFGMSSNYNHRIRPAEYLMTAKGELKTIRQQEVTADIFSNIPDFQW